MRAAISRMVSEAITSPARRDLMRRLRRRPGPPRLDYFHQADDPYSHLLVQMLDPLAARYGAVVRPWLVPPPDPGAAPERDRLARYALGDAALTAREYGLSFPADAKPPTASAVTSAADALAARLADPDFAARAFSIGEALWTGAPGRFSPSLDSRGALAEGAAERRRRGHYLGGMIHFEGEWYWSVDRLHHLEERLSSLGFDTRPGTAPLAPYRDADLAGGAAGSSGARVEMWFSFRSPYSWLAFPRARALASRYGARLELRYILPMVMRGLPVPREKRRYIMVDAKREADRAGLAFGKVVDPVGEAVERALAVLHRAVALGRGEAFAEGALRAIWSQGADLTEDRPLCALALQAGLTAQDVKAALGDQGWRAPAEANRLALLEAGLWGAPTFRVNGGRALWGQDRLWAVEAELKRAAAPEPS